MKKLKLKRQITTSKAATAASKPVPFKYGGLGGKNLELSIKALNTIKSTDLGVNIPVHKTAKLIDMNDVDLKDVLTPILSGPSMVYYNTLHSYTISNYDSFTDYEISADYGIVINVKKKNFSYIGPNTNYQGDYVHITINGFINTIKLAKSYIERPTIVGLSNGDNIEVGTNLSFSDYIIRNGYAEYDQHASTDIQICKDTAFNSNTVINLSRNVSYKRSYIIPKTLEDREYYIRIRYHSTKGMDSLWSIPIRITLFHQYIEKPTIVSPESGTYQPLEITLTGSQPVVRNSSHSFLKSEWQISTDTSFLNPTTITSSNNSYTIITTLEGNKTYYIRTRYLSNHEDLENSSWSNYIIVTAVEGEDDGSGRRFFRHESGMGTVMRWVDRSGNEHNTLVLDAVYRNVLPWASSNTKVPGLTDYPNCSWVIKATSGGNDSYSATDIGSYFGTTMTDESICARPGYFEDVGTSKQNTDAMMAQSYCSGTGYAAGWCRSRSVTHLGQTYNCDLPNIQTLVRFYAAIFKLDQLDPSPNTCKYLLTKARTGMRYNWHWSEASSQYNAWSSTEIDASNACDIGDYSTVAYSPYKTYNALIAPVLEL